MSTDSSDRTSPRGFHWAPSLLVAGAAAVVLFAAPEAARRIGHAGTQREIVQASQRLSGGTILDELNAAYRDIARADALAHAHTRQFRDNFIQYMKQNYLGDADLVVLGPAA